MGVRHNSLAAVERQWGLMLETSKLSIWCGGGSDSYKYAWQLWHVYGDMDCDKNGLKSVFVYLHKR